ncbi:MAG: adenylate/guanylate cyclase domain-containing protein [Pseudomonadota bacterium]
MKNLLVRLRLAFADDAQERAFADRYVRLSLLNIKIYALIGGLCFYSFQLLDTLIDPVNAEFAHQIRLWVLIPIGLALSLFLLTPLGKRWIEGVVIGGGMVGIGGLSYIYAVLDNGYLHFPLGITLVVLGSAIMFPIRFIFLLLMFPSTITIVIAAHYLWTKEPDSWMTVNIITCLTATSFAALAGYSRERAARKQFLTELDLTASRERVEQLLHSMLPREVANRIQAGETAIADSYGEVCIIFADLSGFTELARRISPPHLVKMLNNLFSVFDLEAERLGVERIKTIGDAYMAISGLTQTTAGANHVENAAEFAFAIQRSVQRFIINSGYPINVRIGIHVGPVVAGVIGVKRPAFDVWGESVNFASRLESKAVPGTILISENAHWRLRAGYETEIQGVVDLKGFGESKVYRLSKARAERLTGGEDEAEVLPSGLQLSSN